MKLRWVLVLAAVFIAACTYGPPEDHVSVQNVALKPDATLLAVIVKYERSSPATGLAAFPDGGVPLTLEQRADLYVVDLRSRSLLFNRALPAPGNRRASFSPWLIGWDGDRVDFKVTGCEGTPGSECYGPRVGTSLFTVSPAGQITPVADSPSPVLISSVDKPTQYLSAGVQTDGVALTRQISAARKPLLRFKGVHLEIVTAEEGS